MRSTREQDRAEHERIEKTPLSQAMGRGELTPAEYACMLYAYAELHRDAELALPETGLALLLEPPFKSTLARIDLEALGMRHEHVPLDIRRAVAEARRASGPPFAIGALLGRVYVLEGSSLRAAMFNRSSRARCG